MIISIGIFLIAMVVGRLFELSLLRALPLAFCLAVASASILATALSCAHAVTPGTIRITLLIVGSGVALLLWRHRRGAAQPLTSNAPRWTPLEIILSLTATTMAAVIALLATLYPSSNWDSMTYHLSRVALWIQHQSVFPYPTNNFRQVQLTPGAEYLILVEQLFWFSDVFANWVQLVALVVVGMGVFGWCEHWKISRTTSLLLILTTLPAPMLLMQAQTTQNDLAAAHR